MSRDPNLGGLTMSRGKLVERRKDQPTNPGDKVKNRDDL
jgi:hypothetical protein